MTVPNNGERYLPGRQAVGREAQQQLMKNRERAYPPEHCSSIRNMIHYNLEPVRGLYNSSLEKRSVGDEISDTVTEVYKTLAAMARKKETQAKVSFRDHEVQYLNSEGVRQKARFAIQELYFLSEAYRIFTRGEADCCQVLEASNSEERKQIALNLGADIVGDKQIDLEALLRRDENGIRLSVYYINPVTRRPHEVSARMDYHKLGESETPHLNLEGSNLTEILEGVLDVKTHFVEGFSWIEDKDFHALRDRVWEGIFEKFDQKV